MTHHCWTFGNWYFIMKSCTLSNENHKYFSISFLFYCIRCFRQKLHAKHIHICPSEILLLFFVHSYEHSFNPKSNTRKSNIRCVLKPFCCHLNFISKNILMIVSNLHKWWTATSIHLICISLRFNRTLIFLRRIFFLYIYFLSVVGSNSICIKHTCLCIETSEWTK